VQYLRGFFHDNFDLILCIFKEQTTGVAGTPAGWVPYSFFINFCGTPVVNVKYE
jgi:hypothetical protein